MKSHKYFAFGSLICVIMAMLYDVFLYQKVRGGAMQDILSERHLKISTFRIIFDDIRIESRIAA